MARMANTTKARGAKKAAKTESAPSRRTNAQERAAAAAENTESAGIAPDQETAAASARAQAEAAGVSGQAVMVSSPTGYANGAGQMVDITGDGPYELTGGDDDAPTGPPATIGGEVVENKRARAESKD